MPRVERGNGMTYIPSALEIMEWALREQRLVVSYPTEAEAKKAFDDLVRLATELTPPQGRKETT